MPPVPGSDEVGRDRDPACRARRACAWSRAAISWCRGCSITTRAYIFQNPDAASCSRFPIERDFTLIGTTDENFQGDPAGGRAVARAEIDYLCETAMRYFRRAVSPDDIVWTFAGVRSLYDDGSEEAGGCHARLSSRPSTRASAMRRCSPSTAARSRPIGRLAEAALRDARRTCFAPSRPWTARAPLPGGDFPYDGVDAAGRARRAGPGRS